MARRRGRGQAETFLRAERSRVQAQAGGDNAQAAAGATATKKRPAGQQRTADSGQAETQTTVPQSVTRVTGPGDGGGVTEERIDRDWNAQL